MNTISPPPETAPPHEHPPYLAHHFDTPAQQQDAATLGMWLFLATEILLFGGLFCAYAVYRANHPEIFIYAHQFLDKTLGAVNTVVLLCSSFTMAAGVWAAQHGRRRLQIVMLALTLLGGFGFLGIKYVEYKAKWQHGQLPGRYYAPHVHGDAHGEYIEILPGMQWHAPEGSTPHEATTAPADQADANAATAGHSADANTPTAGSQAAPAAGSPTGASDHPTPAAPPGSAAAGPVDPNWAFHSFETGPRGLLRPGAADAPLRLSPDREVRNVQLFFSVYFGMTGLHGLHVIAGLVVIAWILVRTVLGHFSAAYYTPVHMVGLYWHVVDLIWIYLFPLFYLIH